MSIENKMKIALVNYGAMNEDWRIKVISVETDYSDWAKVIVEVYKPRHKTPCTCWTLFANMVREFVDFERSEHIRLK